MTQENPSLLTEESLSYIGKVGERVTGYPISAHEVKRFCYAVDDLNPRYLDPEYAARAGLDGIEAPPMFLTIPFDCDVPLSQLTDDGIPAERKGMIVPPLNAKRRLWGGVQVEFFQRIRPGDVLTLQNKVIDIRERQGKSGPMVFVLIETTYTNQRDEKVAVEINTVIAR